MKTGSRGLALIKSFEKLMLKAYDDGGGVITIGYGHTAAAGPPKPRIGMRITEVEADAIFARDLVKYETAVEKVIHRPMTQNQFDAMTSLCFNIGPSAFAGSRVAKLFNAGDEVRAADAFTGWTKDNGRRLAGLVRRRKAERRLFLSKTSRAKWAVAATGGAVAGEGLFHRFGASALESLGFRAADLVTWEFLAIIGVVAGVLGIVVIAAIGHERRERLWNKLFGGWLS